MADALGEPLSAADIRRRRKQEAMEEQMLKEGGDENVTVCVRNRIFNRREVALQVASNEGDLRSVVEMPDGVNGKVRMMNRDPTTGEYTETETFNFTKSFWSVSEEQQPYPFAPISQFDVYEIVGKPIIKYAMFGFNNCVFAYGQTGAGKTYTMMGDFQTEGNEFTGNPGLVPQLCKGLFERVHEERTLPEPGMEKTISVKLSAIEIYNEQVRDLFWRSTPGRTKNTVLKVRVHPTDGAFVDGLTVLEPKNWEHCLRLIDKGISERTVAATLMNDESSRSHSVFQITVTQTETIQVKPDPDMDDEEMRFVKPVTHTKVSRINLVDLAGSERLKKSGAQGQQLKEAAGINQSLSTLKKVIDALVTNSTERNPKKHVIVPFRESTLTQLLSHSLGGNSKTVMIACVSPHFDNQEETLLTLRYANRTSGIVNHAKVNEDSAAKSALALKHQILELQRKLQDGEGEEGEELRDQLELGRRSLRELENANKRLEQKQAELIAKTQKEEGARFAAAFYNTVKMVLLQQEKEQLAGRIDDTSSRLKEEEKEKRRLKEQLDEGTEQFLSQKALLDRMLRDEGERREEDHRSDDLVRTLAKEYGTVKRKMDEELGNRWGMKLVNYRRLAMQRRNNEDAIERVRDQNEHRLDDTILGAAEQYERQVKEYADRDTRSRHRTQKIEQKLPEIHARREELEAEAAAIHLKLRQAEKAHQYRLQEIEAKWRAKYNRMKDDGEAEVKAAEDAYHTARLAADAEIDRASTASQTREVAAVDKLESDLRLLEGAQASKVANASVAAAETIALKAFEQEKQIDKSMSDAKAKFRKRISALVAAVRASQAAADEFETAQARLHDQVLKFEAPQQRVLAHMIPPVPVPSAPAPAPAPSTPTSASRTRGKSIKQDAPAPTQPKAPAVEPWLHILQLAWANRGHVQLTQRTPSSASSPGVGVGGGGGVGGSAAYQAEPMQQPLRSSTPRRAVAKAAMLKNAVSPLRMPGDPLSIPVTTRPQYVERQRSKSPTRTAGSPPGAAGGADEQQSQKHWSPPSTPPRYRSRTPAKTNHAMADSQGFWTRSLRGGGASTPSRTTASSKNAFAVNTSKSALRERERGAQELEPATGKSASVARNKDQWQKGLRPNHNAGYNFSVK